MSTWEHNGRLVSILEHNGTLVSTHELMVKYLGYSESPISGSRAIAHLYESASTLEFFGTP